MRQLGSLRRNHLQHGTARRAYGDIPQHIAPGDSAHPRFPFFASSSKNSDARQASAMIVRVGFLSGFVTRGAPSITNTFFTSCAWQNAFNTDVRGSAPIRAVPTS